MPEAESAQEGLRIFRLRFSNPPPYSRILKELVTSFLLSYLLSSPITRHPDSLAGLAAVPATVFSTGSVDRCRTIHTHGCISRIEHLREVSTHLPDHHRPLCPCPIWNVGHPTVNRSIRHRDHGRSIHLSIYSDHVATGIRR